MRISAFIDAIEEHGAALAVAAEQAGPGTAVAACPGWSVATLLGHLGVVHRWAAEIVRERRAGRPPGPDPAPEGEPLVWYREGHAQLLAALREAPADLDCWTLLPSPYPLLFWARRQAHETAVHRVDAEAACGRAVRFAPEFAADGIDELLVTLVGDPDAGERPADQGRRVLVRPTDVAARWLLATGPAAAAVPPVGAAPADCVVTGTASDLYVWLWKRDPAAPVVVSGDGALADRWREAVVIER